jgi:hypothetical protein
MRKISIALSLILSVIISTACAAERAWLQISNSKAAEVFTNFQTPPPENGMTLWWGWDGPVTEEVITRDLDRIKAMGFTCVMIEAGSRMSAKYLSPEWFNLFKFAVDQARQRDMRVWIEDEGKYPSGFAGGKITQERPDLRMQALVVGDRIDVPAGQTVTHKTSADTISAVACNLDNNESKVLSVDDGEVTFTAPPQGKWQIRTTQHAFHSGPTAWVDEPTGARKSNAASLCDYMNPEATKQIIAWTHEGYKKAAGDEFGHTFMGLMGDEPAFSGTPWTPKMLEEFQKRKGYDVRPYLAWIASSGNIPEEARRAKADYWDVWSDLFSQNYFKVLADWCAANNCEYIIHMDQDNLNLKFVRSGGDYFKNMRPVAIPGIDVIWAQIWFDNRTDYPKMASSAAHLFGKPHAFTESFAAFTNPVDGPKAKWIINYQLVRGINVVQVMFMRASSGGVGRAGGAPTAAPPPVADSTTAPVITPNLVGPRRGGFYTSPEFPPVAKYVHRCSYLLSQGRPAAQIGLYMPTTSLWMGDNAADESNLAIAQKLLAQQRDFDWIDEQALSSLLKLEGSELKNLSGQTYRAIIVPTISVISKAALDRLKAFSQAGGIVIFLGKEPNLVVDKTFLHAISEPVDLSWATMREPTGEFTAKLIEALPKSDVEFDKPVPSIKYLHRRLADADVYFFFNEDEKDGHSCNAILSGKGQAQLWNAYTGYIENVAGASTQNGQVRVSLDLEHSGTKIIVVGPPVKAASAAE